MQRTNTGAKRGALRRSWLAPICAVVVLAGVRPFVRLGAAPIEGVESYFADIEQTVLGLPYRVGDWIGMDIPVTPAANRLLKPNVVKQRRYVHTSTRREISVLIVHCSSTRDMLGHYPPVCYKAHGWGAPAEVHDRSAAAEGARLPAKEYTFRRMVDGFEQELTVFNFFVLPGGGQHFFDDMDGLDIASRKPASAGLGAAQFQIISGGGVSQEERSAAAQEFVTALGPTIRAIVRGAPDNG